MPSRNVCCWISRRRGRRLTLDISLVTPAESCLHSGYGGRLHFVICGSVFSGAGRRCLLPSSPSFALLGCGSHSELTFRAAVFIAAPPAGSAAAPRLRAAAPAGSKPAPALLPACRAAQERTLTPPAYLEPRGWPSLLPAYYAWAAPALPPLATRSCANDARRCRRSFAGVPRTWRTVLEQAALRAARAARNACPARLAPHMPLYAFTAHTADIVS